MHDCCTLQVDMTKVNLDTIKPWITRQITELLGFEDDVVIEFIFNQLEERVNYLEFILIYTLSKNCTYVFLNNFSFKAS